MKKFRTLSIVLGVLLMAGCQPGKSQVTDAMPQDKAPDLSSFHTYKNLSVYLIRGEDQVSREYISLEEAMDHGNIALHETGDVGELSADNKSNKHIFIMSGDIVKGGKQDRTIAEDIILKPGAKKVPLKSFCVEQSRWQQRGSENVAEFSSSKKILSNKNLKIAAREKKQQSEVWNEVSSFQEKAGENINKDVKSQVSATSLQLTLEDKDLQLTAKEYIEAIEPFFEGKTDVLGFVFCVNGKISTTDYFGNAKLFAKLRAKLLESAANEAVFQYQEKQEQVAPSVKDIATFMSSAEKGEERVTDTGENTVEKRYKADHSVMFHTYNTDAGENPVHVSIFSTDDIDMSDNGNSRINQNQQFRSGGLNRVR